MDHLNNAERGLVLQVLRDAKWRLQQELQDAKCAESAARAFIVACDAYNEYEREFISRLDDYDSITITVEADDNGFLIAPLTPNDITGAIDNYKFPIKELGLYDLMFEEAGVRYSRKVWVVPK